MLECQSDNKSQTAKLYGGVVDEMISDLRLQANFQRFNPTTPLLQFLQQSLEKHAADNSGVVANYIPELAKANPAHFGISLATIDGYVYEVGDSSIPFTIQSISKAFVFALALETVGATVVEETIGVEPSGDAFNSIRLNSGNRPFNAMVNSGAIACSGLIYKAEGRNAFERIRQSLSRFAGRQLSVDDAVFLSEYATGDRNRAIAYLLRTYNVIEGDVDAVLDVYFRQCSILVTARDLAVMAATLANGGINPVSGEKVLSPYAVARTLSVMTSSGMYDYAGEWIYRVGIPAKSGVGGGIIAALPAQLGLGTFSPRLDDHGNSVRGLRICEELSSHFDLHVLGRSGDVKTCINADYDIAGISSRRGRQPHEEEILGEHSGDIRIIELVGALSFATIDFVSRQLTFQQLPQLVLLDFRRVPTITNAAARLLADCVRNLGRQRTTTVLSGLEDSWPVIGPQLKGLHHVRRFDQLDESIEWAEDQIIYRYGGYDVRKNTAHLNAQALLAGLANEVLDAISELCIRRIYHTGEKIVAAGDPASSVFFLQSGMVSVKLPSGVRLASLVQGMAFGEMSLIEERRTADVWADASVTCLELSLPAYIEFCDRNPRAGQQIVRNLAILLAKRLILANTKVELLTAY